VKKISPENLLVNTAIVFLPSV